MSSSFSVEKARAQFPALAKPQIFGDNAGGSQTLGTVATRQHSIAEYLVKTNVQLGASYQTSIQSTGIFDSAYKAAAKYINAGIDEIVIGASTTQVLRNLAAALKLQPGDELILSEVDHESNIDPWLHYAALTGATVKWWTPSDRKNPILDPATLRGLLTNKTRLVACTHCSNILGTINDIKAIANVVHEIPGALLAVDGVAYAPHRAVDVTEIGADFYAFSWYKVYGPHISLLYGSTAAQAQLRSLGHYFNPSGSLMDKLELAAASYELTQAIIPLVAYFGEDPKQTWAGIADHEEKLQARLIEYLVSRPEITLYGETSTKNSVRVPTISFTVEGRSSQSVVEAVETVSNVGIRWGHFFSKRLIEKTLGLSDDGVVRVSLVHYNTTAKVVHPPYYRLGVSQEIRNCNWSQLR
ncbi:Aminotransferase-like protein fgm3 [Fusarium piperis]|uniref:Aminotransferase-like protein fgm3 n=1 Tax=Fusarium piperis TaxID=1435070 RepID=A0A9W8W5T1_9HYPO|nr:Aminotransferase-like protein fgm3 [Fusarium piperis]